MKHLNTILESKFSQILSGQCLTSLREENKKILQGEVADFTQYVENFLRIRGYEVADVERNISTGRVTAKINGEVHDFFIDFDHGPENEELFLKIAENGTKAGISETECKYVLVISTQKEMIYLMSIGQLKNSAKKKKKGYRVISEQRDSGKIQYLSIDLVSGNSKHKAFVLK